MYGVNVHLSSQFVVVKFACVADIHAQTDNICSTVCMACPGSDVIKIKGELVPLR